MRTRLAALTITTALLTSISMVGAPAIAFADEIRDSQWYLNSFNIDKVHELSQGAGVTIGVIDSGIDPDVPDLEGNVKAGAQFDGDGVVDGDGLTDTQGHGTAVSSVLVGHGHGNGDAAGVMGIAPKANVVSARIDWETLPSGDRTETVIDAIRWLIDQDVDIISASIGVNSSNDGISVLKEASKAGIPVVGSTGNRFKEAGEWGTIEETVTHWPARGAGAIPVSGTTPDGTFWKDGISLSDAALQPQLGLSAPAVDIPIALPDNNYDTVNGTSFSAPIVAGTLALIKSAYPDLSYYQWTDRLLDTADDKGDKGFDNKYGWGIVNPYKALTEETTYEGSTGNEVSSPDDRLPLDEQGKNPRDENETSPDDNTKSSENSGQALTPGPTAGLPLWVIVSLGVAAVAIIAIVILVIRKIRRPKQNQPLMQFQPGTPHGSFSPPGSGNGQ